MLLLQNTQPRPVSMLAVFGMILEKVVALQIEEFFESNGLLGNFSLDFENIRVRFRNCLHCLTLFWKQKKWVKKS